MNNSGNWNSGHRNSGNWNSGHRNSGHRDSGHLNSGNRNSGDLNSGNWNSGHRNSGHLNSGDRNSGHWNSGDWNSGDWNSGNWNSGNRNSGHLNSNQPTVRMFNRETGMTHSEVEKLIPKFFYFDAIEWVQEEVMTDEEKRVYPSYKTTGGYLKDVAYKEAWRKAWNKAGEDDRKKVLKLPNWDNDIFKRITGIDIEKELKPKRTIEIDGKTIKLSKESYANLKKQLE